jgi:asparagine synthase (glutamine-hydrolysing)
VSIGSCLSGGLDSSSIVCEVNDLLKEGGHGEIQKTFSSCSEFREYDERGYIDQVISERAIDGHCTYPKVDDLFSHLGLITWHQDEPNYSTSIFSQWEVFRLAGENEVRVMLDGQGADEILAGYHHFFTARLMGLWRSLRWIALIREMRAMKRIHGLPFRSSLKLIISGLLAGSAGQGGVRSLLARPGVPAWLHHGELQATPGYPRFPLPEGNTDLQHFSYNQVLWTSLPILLHYEDRNSMAHSVEARVPFLDYRLVEFVFGLPDDCKISGGVTKLVMRESLRSILPECIYDRMDKMGFVSPAEIWVREVNPDLFREGLREAVQVSGGILDPSAPEYLEEIIRGDRPYDPAVWRMISLGTWMKTFQVVR